MRQQGCNHLQGCIKIGKQVLDSLQPRWDPRRQMSRTQPESMPFEEGETELLTHMNTGQNLWSEFRVFTEPRAHQVESAVRPPPEPEQETITVHIAAKMKTSKESEPQPVGGLWYGDEDGRNTRFTSTRASTDTTICVAEAALLAIQQNDPNAKLRIITSSRRLKKTLTTDLPKREDEGWLQIKAGRVFQKLIAAIRSRPGVTTMTRISKLDRSIKKTNDLALSTEEAEKTVDPPHLQGYDTFLVTGAKISTSTQANLYRAILNQRNKALSRRQSLANLEITKFGVAEIANHQPTSVEVWNGIRRKEFGNRISTFLWKTIHGAYKCGEYWAHIPGYEERSMCHTCNTLDTVEHALLECRASGQEHIWRLAEQLWLRRGLPWIRPTLGTLLGCGLARFHPENEKKQLTGANRLYALVVATSFRLAWNLSRKHKIEDEEDENKILPRA
ncbi:hypothetical protein CVT26_010605, partial [Gymnopilus dilepis]